MNLRRLFHLVVHPVETARLIHSDVLDKLNPERPWLAPDAVRFCEQRLDSRARALEWGSGRSTLWFARRVAHLTSIEYDGSWFEKVGQLLADAGLANVDLRHVPLEHPLTEGTVPYYALTPRYVSAAGDFAENSLDLAIIDGHYRQACVLAVLPRLKEGGLLLIDNSDRLPASEWGVPSDWPLLHCSRGARTQTSIWQKPSSSTNVTAASAPD